MKFVIKKFKVTDYLITPRDIYRGVLYVARRISVRDVVGALIVIGASIILRFVLSVSGDSLFFWPFIIAIIYWHLDARVSFGLALATLVAIPVLLILFNQAIVLTGEYWAERVAVWTYFFLVIGVVKQIVEYILEQKLKKKKLPAIRLKRKKKPSAKPRTKKLRLDIAPSKAKKTEVKKPRSKRG